MRVEVRNGRVVYVLGGQSSTPAPPPPTLEQRKAHLAADMRHWSDDEVLSCRGTERHSLFVGSLKGKDWRDVWMHEFNRRFLLRPLEARPNTQDGETLLRAI